MEISHKIEFVQGPFETKTGQLVAVMKRKYGDVHLCFEANMNITFAKIKLFSSDLAVDADATMESAYALGNEIARRFNEFPEDLKK